MKIFAIWIVAAMMIGIAGKNKKFGFAGHFLISLFLTPFVGLLVLLASDALPEHPRE
jgi:hypothetical protein